MFLSEVLSNTLQEEEQNETLYSYLESTFLWLDSQSDYANFHLLFLLKLTKYLGFYPDTTLIDFPFFNLQEGMFEIKPSNNYALSGISASAISHLKAELRIRKPAWLFARIYLVLDRQTRWNVRR